MKASLDTAPAMAELLAHAKTFDAALWARLIAHRAASDQLEGLGLTLEEIDALRRRHFPGASVKVPERLRSIVLTPAAADFAAGIRELLALYRSADSDDALPLAKVVALACLRPDHLWRDLGLRGRDDVSAMFDRHFPTLSSRNVSEMRWKKFLAFELSARRGLAPTAAPGCTGCEDQAFCYPDGLPSPGA